MFLRSLSQNIAVLTAVVTSLTQNWVKKSSNLYFMYQWWQKMKINSKETFEVKYFWNCYIKILKFWLPVVRSSTQKWVKKVQIDISCSNVDRKMKIKRRSSFRLIIRLWNHSHKSLRFWLNLLTSSTQIWLENGRKLVFHVLMVIERWK